MRILVGDILKSKAQTLINTVNCVGVMGKGIALEFKNRFPDMYEEYVQRCQRGEVKPGVPYLYRTLFPPQIINFPTKDHWKSISKLSDIERGLRYLLQHYEAWGVTSLAIPPLGCGNGQLEWRAVGPLIYRYGKGLAIPVEMYAPYGTNPKEITEEFLAQESNRPIAETVVKSAHSGLSPAWVALVEILARIEEQPYHWPVGRTLFQKLAYVATNEGLPTGLHYQRGSFGPFSSDLKSLEAKLINNGLLQEERHGTMFMVKIGPNFLRIRQKYSDQFQEWGTILDKTVDLFSRVNTDQAEIIASVLFAARELKQEERTPSETALLDAVMHWKQKRRPPLDRGKVASAIRNLAALEWLSVIPDPNLPLPEDEVVPA